MSNVIRYMYVNSTRSSHAIEKRTLTVNGEEHQRTSCLCGMPFEVYEWRMSFHPKKRLCKTCEMIMEWNEGVLQRKYRVLKKLHSTNKDNPFVLPAGAVSVAITRDDHGFWVHFLELNKVVMPLRYMENMKESAEWFECIYDPTNKEVESLPLDTLPLFGGSEATS